MPKEPSNFSIRPYRESSDLAQEGEGLSPEQRRQYSRTIELYLSGHRQVSSIQNIKAVYPVIQYCVKEGLMLLEGRDQLLPADNVTRAFNRGNRRRSESLSAAEVEIKKISPASPAARYLGDFALNKTLVTQAQRELDTRLTIQRPVASEQLREMVLTRAPIFDQMVKSCKQEVEQSIPGAASVPLTHAQEAGLIRLMVFSWVVYGEPNMFLETEAIMSNRQEYDEIVKSSGDELWMDLLAKLNLSGGEALEFIKAISGQISDLVSTLPSNPSRGASSVGVVQTIAAAHRILEPYFLVSNPLKRVQLTEERSPEDPLKQSIWADDRVITVEFKDRKYQVPNPANVKILATALDLEDRIRGSELMHGEIAISRFLQAVEGVHNNPYAESQAAVDRADQAMKEYFRQIIAGEIPSSHRMEFNKVNEMLGAQLAIMEDDLAAFSGLRQAREAGLDKVWDYLRMFSVGIERMSASKHRDFVNLLGAPSRLQSLGVQLIDGRIRPKISAVTRFNNFQKLFGEIRGVSSPSEVNSRVVTVQDVLRFRGIFFANLDLREAGNRMQKVDPEYWRGFFTGEKDQIEELIYKEASDDGRITDQEIIDKNSLFIRRRRIDLAAYLANLSNVEADILHGNPVESSATKILRFRGPHIIDDTLRSLIHEYRPRGRMGHTSSPLGLGDNFDGLIQINYDSRTILRRVMDTIIRLAPDNVGVLNRTLSLDSLVYTHPESIRYSGFFDNSLDVKNRTRTNLQESLASHGLFFGRELGHYLDRNSIDRLNLATLFYKALFSLEAEAKDWYQQTAEKIKEQQADTGHKFYFTGSVLGEINKRRDAYDRAQKALASNIEENERSIQSRITQLRILGLIQTV